MNFFDIIPSLTLMRNKKPKDPLLSWFSYDNNEFLGFNIFLKVSSIFYFFVTCKSFFHLLYVHYIGETKKYLSAPNFPNQSLCSVPNCSDASNTLICTIC